MDTNQTGIKDKNNNLLSCLSEKELKFRTYFKNYIIVEFALLCICSVIGHWNNTTDQLILIIPLTIEFCMLYHCAYKNHGTGLLAFIMIISYPYWIFRVLSNASGSEDPVEWIVFLLATCIFGLFYFFGLRIRKINKKIQSFAFLSSDHFQEAVASIRSAQNLDDLTFKFHEAFRECPGSFANVLSPYYEEMKKHLSQTTRSNQ